MDKKEYFESLLRRDFLRYVLLRTPYLPEDNVVEQLMDAVAATVDIRQLKDGIRKVKGQRRSSVAGLTKIFD